jgi:hypothetical protein
MKAIMETATIRIFAVACGGIATVSTVFYHVMKFKEVKTLREIPDRLGK